MIFYIPFTKIKIPVPIATIFLTALLIACIVVRFIMPFSEAIEKSIPNYYHHSIVIGAVTFVLLVIIWGWEILSNINSRT